jgi:hypothetical protein
MSRMVPTQNVGEKGSLGVCALATAWKDFQRESAACPTFYRPLLNNWFLLRYTEEGLPLTCCLLPACWVCQCSSNNVTEYQRTSVLAGRNEQRTDKKRAGCDNNMRRRRQQVLEDNLISLRTCALAHQRVLAVRAKPPLPPSLFYSPTHSLMVSPSPFTRIDTHSFASFASHSRHSFTSLSTRSLIHPHIC